MPLVFAAVNMLAFLGLGLLLCAYAANQEQAMLMSFFIMMIFILMGGLYTSINSMPKWAKWITRFNPVCYFIDVMGIVVLKGSSLYDIRFHLLSFREASTPVHAASKLIRYDIFPKSFHCKTCEGH